MEDDLKEQSKDDHKPEDDPGGDQEDNNDTRRQHDPQEAYREGRMETIHHQDIAGVGHPPPPPLGLVLPPPPIEYGSEATPVEGASELDSGGRLRAGSIEADKHPSGNKNSIPVKNPTRSQITVNGVNLMEIYKKKKEDSMKKTPRSKKKPLFDSSSSGKTTPSSDKKGTLLNFLVRKKQPEKHSDSKEDNPGIDSDSSHASYTTTPQLHSQESNVVIEDKGEELRTKLTFSSPHQKRVQDKIKMFELTPSVGGGVSVCKWKM